MRLEFLILEHGEEAAPGEFFKRQGDAPSYLRIAPSWPSGTELIERDVMVAGISQPDRQEALALWACGEHRQIALEREPWNRYDENAIAVYASWKSGRRLTRHQVGYIQREIAAEVAGVMDAHGLQAWPTTLFPPSEEYTGGLRLALGIVSAPPPLPPRPPTVQPIKPVEPKPSLRERLDSFVKKHVAAPQRRPRGKR